MNYLDALLQLNKYPDQTSSSTSQVYNYAIDNYFFWAGKPTFNASWSGATNMLLWPTVSSSIAWINSTQVIYTNPVVLIYGMNHDVIMTIVNYRLSNFEWLYFDSGAFLVLKVLLPHYPHNSAEIIRSVATPDSSTTASFTYLPFQNVIVQQSLIAQTIFVVAGHILSSVGGIFAFVDGVYAIIFGRTILAIVTGKSP